jgi:hypothetical protein
VGHQGASAISTSVLYIPKWIYKSRIPLGRLTKRDNIQAGYGRSGRFTFLAARSPLFGQRTEAWGFVKAAAVTQRLLRFLRLRLTTTVSDGSLQTQRLLLRDHKLIHGGVFYVINGRFGWASALYNQSY